MIGNDLVKRGLDLIDADIGEARQFQCIKQGVHHNLIHSEVLRQPVTAGHIQLVYATKGQSVMLTELFFPARKRSASSAAMQPIPADVTAWRNSLS